MQRGAVFSTSMRPSIGFDPHACIEEIQIQCRHEGIVESGHDLARLLPAPNRGKREHADQIAHAALKVLSFPHAESVNAISGLAVAGGYSGPDRRARYSCRNSCGGMKNGFCCRMPPIMTSGCVRRISITASPLN